MGRIVFTKDEAQLLQELAKARRQTPGEVLRQLILEDALKRRLPQPDAASRQTASEQARGVDHAQAV